NFLIHRPHGSRDLDAARPGQAVRAMRRSLKAPRVGENPDLARGKDAGDLAQFRLKYFVGLMKKALFVGLQTMIALPAGDDDLAFLPQARRTFIVIARQWLLEPVTSDLLKRMRGRQRLIIGP